MSAGLISVPPSILWAQRNDLLYITVAVECKDVNYTTTEDSFSFTGTGVTDSKIYKFTLNFLHKVDPEKVTSKNTARCIQYTIKKAEQGPYWASLTNDKKKPHYLKVDFNKWVDEDNVEETAALPNENVDLMSMLNKLNTDESKHSFDDLEDQSEDSDDENLPNLE